VGLVEDLSFPLYNKLPNHLVLRCIEFLGSSFVHMS